LLQLYIWEFLDDYLWIQIKLSEIIFIKDCELFKDLFVFSSFMSYI